MDLRAAAVTDEQPLELVEPGEGALDDPAGAAETRAVLALASCDLRRDPAPAELAPLRPVVVGAVGGDPVRTATRPADLAPHRRHALEERKQLGYVIAVAAGERPGEWDPARVYEKVMLGA